MAALRGIGTVVIRAAAELYPDRRLVTSTKGADTFWAGLGWRICLYAGGASRRLPFFVS